MKKFLTIFLATLTFSIIIPPSSVFAQTTNTEAVCGTIGNSCCSDFNIHIQKEQIPVVGSIPIIGDLAGMIVDSIFQLGSDHIDAIKQVAENARVDKYCPEGTPYNSIDPTQKFDPTNCKCKPFEPAKILSLCKNIKNESEIKSCTDCSSHGFWTSLGCVDFKLQNFLTQTVFGLGLGLGGAVTLGCIIMAAIQLQFSQGDPKRIQKIRETLTSCITGLLMIIFAIFILRVIGVDILRIPGFSK